MYWGKSCYCCASTHAKILLTAAITIAHTCFYLHSMGYLKIVNKLGARVHKHKKVKVLLKICFVYAGLKTEGNATPTLCSYSNCQDMTHRVICISTWCWQSYSVNIELKTSTLGSSLFSSTPGLVDTGLC